MGVAAIKLLVQILNVEVVVAEDDAIQLPNPFQLPNLMWRVP